MCISENLYKYKSDVSNASLYNGNSIYILHVYIG